MGGKTKAATVTPLPPFAALCRPYFMMIIFFVNRRPSTTSW